MKTATAMILVASIAALTGCASMPNLFTFGNAAVVLDAYEEWETEERAQKEQAAREAAIAAAEAAKAAEEAAEAAETRTDTTISNGYVWKPVSEGDGKLVVLFPNAYKGKIESAGIYSALPPSPSTLIEAGKFKGDTANGNRPHYRYKKPGSSYGKNIFSVAILKDGTIKSYPRSNGGNREG